MMQVEISGADDIAKTLREMSDATRGKISMEAMITALTPVVTSAQAFARSSRDTGNLCNSIGFRVRAYSRKSKIVAVIGPRRGFKVVDRSGSTRNASKYGHLVEFGHMAKNGKQVAAKPFMRPGFASSEGKAMQDMANVFRQRIEMVVKRKARKRK